MDNIYRAHTKGGKTGNLSYVLYKKYETSITNSANSCSSISDASKHIIIVFETEGYNNSNDAVYSEFKYMLNDVIARVKKLNANKENPRVNLIGHSRGGITNLQYVLEFPENVASLISIGTPYFGSQAAESFGEIVMGGSSDGLNDINNEILYNGYYQTWKNGYESKYKNINSIAIGGTTTIEYQRTVLEESNGQYSDAISLLLFCYENALLQGISVPIIKNLYSIFVEQYPMLSMFTEDEFVELITLINSEVHYSTWYSDVLVPVDSQQGFSGDKNYYFSKYVKEFSSDNTTTNPKRAVNDLPIIHNLETYDADIHNYILNNIVLKSGDTIDNEISNVGKIEYTDDLGNETYKWQIKIRNTYEETRTYAYNSKMCFLDDAKNWTNLTDIVIFQLEAGCTKIVEIEPNVTATSIAVSSISGSKRYIKYADNLWFHSDIRFKDEIYKMTTYSNFKDYYSYTKSGMKVSIAGKNGNTWLIELTNNTGGVRSFYYNKKMCFESDAQNWTGLSNITQTGTLASGASTIIEIEENGSATSIVVCYISGSMRRIFYAYDLSTTGSMISYSASKTYNSYTQNGMKVGIVGKNGSTWLIELTNNTGSAQTFYYNSKMCFAGDAEKWTGLSNETSVYLANGESTQLEITENGTASGVDGMLQ